MGEPIEAVFENGVFRPLQPVNLPEQQRVILLLSESESGVRVAKNSRHAEDAEMDHEVSYQPLPLKHCQTIRVQFQHASDHGPLPYPIEEDDADALAEMGQP